LKFNEDEVDKIRALNEAKIDDLQKTADRLRELVKAGSDAPKDLQAADSALLQGRLQAEKDLFEAEQSLRVAIKTESTLERQLIAADVPPDLLTNAREGTVIVAADVPESRVPLIHIGAACTARFYGLPDITFSGKVGRIGSVLVKDRRTLRVLFVIQDPDNRLHSNMFAEVGLGTDERDAIVVPSDSLVHDLGTDYVLIASGDNAYRAAEVVAGDPVSETRVEILKGLNPGEKIISTGAILLKPFVVKSLEEVK
jgi:membrane fusion protein, heavy metal efflux system